MSPTLQVGSSEPFRDRVHDITGSHFRILFYLDNVWKRSCLLRTSVHSALEVSLLCTVEIYLTLTFQLIVDGIEKQLTDDYIQLTVYFYCLLYSLTKGHWIWVNSSRIPPVPYSIWADPCIKAVSLLMLCQCCFVLGLWSLFQPHRITVIWLAPLYCWWQRHVCVNNLPKVVMWQL